MRKNIVTPGVFPQIFKIPNRNGCSKYGYGKTSVETFGNLIP